LLIVDALAMIGIGLSVGEIFPKHGRSLGLIDSELVWPLLGISLGVAAFCTFKMIRIISQSNCVFASKLPVFGILKLPRFRIPKLPDLRISKLPPIRISNLPPVSDIFSGETWHVFASAQILNSGFLN